MNILTSKTGHFLLLFLSALSIAFAGSVTANAQVIFDPSPGSTVEDAVVIQQIAIDEVNRIEANLAKKRADEEATRKSIEKIQSPNLKEFAEKRAELMKKIGQLSYYVSRSKGYIEGKMSTVVFNAPDAFIVQWSMYAVRYGVVIPALVSSGLGWVAATIEPLPIEFALMFPYIELRKLIARQVYKFRIGIDPETLKSVLFKDLDIDLRTTDLSVFGQDPNSENYWLLPVQHGKGETDWISVEGLEAIVGMKDPEFTRQLKILNLEPGDHINSLKLKIREDEELYTVYVEKAKKLAFSDLKSEDQKRLMEFYHQTEDFFKRARLEVGAAVPEIALTKPAIYIPWLRGLFSKAWYSFKLGRFRSLQVETLGRYHMLHKKDPAAARALLAGSSAEAAFLRRQLLADLENLKTRYSTYHENKGVTGAQCRALFN